jgi:hypothetical protein
MKNLNNNLYHLFPISTNWRKISAASNNFDSKLEPFTKQYHYSSVYTYIPYYAVKSVTYHSYQELSDILKYIVLGQFFGKFKKFY